MSRLVGPDAELPSVAARRADLAAHVDRIVADWPALTEAQIGRIAALLRSDTRAPIAPRPEPTPPAVHLGEAS